jgi:hypothetical protein
VRRTVVDEVAFIVCGDGHNNGLADAREAFAFDDEVALLSKRFPDHERVLFADALGKELVRGSRHKGEFRHRRIERVERRSCEVNICTLEEESRRNTTANINDCVALKFETLGVGPKSPPNTRNVSGVGCSVGLAVGETDGMAIGPAVGSAVGAAVGLAVGAAVGAAVGVAVVTPIAQANANTNMLNQRF